MKRCLAMLPVVGILVFLTLYFYAASIYPGGTKFNPATRGYSHIDNYWCDLLDPITYSGQLNPSRFFALVAIVLLPLSLIFFWYFVPVLFVGRRWKGKVVQGTGCLSMILAALIPLAHDTFINFASIFGFIAFAMTLAGLFQSKEFRLFVTALIAILFFVANYSMWQTGYMLPLMPLVQKMAFLSFFIWITLSARRILQSLDS